MMLQTLFNQLPQAIADAPPEQLAAVLAQLAACQSAVAARLVNGDQNGAAQDGTTTEGPGELLTIDQVARRLNVPKSNAYELVRQNKLRAIRLGKYVRVAPDMLAQYVATLATSSQPVNLSSLKRRRQ